MREFKQQFIKMNRSNKQLNPIGIVLHETATQGATAQNEFIYFNNNKVGASAHAFVDWAESVQFIPWTEKAWHACEPANSMFIGVEMCRPKDNDPKKKEKMLIVYNASVEDFARLFKYVLNINKITKENIMSHDEVRIKWKNTSHTDPTAYLKEIGKSMDIFRKDVQAKLNELNTVKNNPFEMLKQHKIIGDTFDWEDNCKSNNMINGVYCKALMNNFYKNKTKLWSFTFTQVLEYLVSEHVITDVNYWAINTLPNGKVEGKNMEIVIKRMAELL